MSQITLAQQYQSTRAMSELLCKNLAIEDLAVQPREEVSPPKWHLGHTSWFFEKLILKTQVKQYKEFHPAFDWVFNSYYKSQGRHWRQGERGQLSRPTYQEILHYREQIDHQMLTLLDQKSLDPKLFQLVMIGLHHEQQHQELLLMDIKAILGQAPFYTAYMDSPAQSDQKVVHQYIPIHSDHVLIGQNEVSYLKDQVSTLLSQDTFQHGFAYCNESPQHSIKLPAFQMGNRPVNNGEFLAFIESGGYQDSMLWRSEAWDFLQEHHWQHPQYWKKIDQQWYEYQLTGLAPLNLEQPVSHLNFYEADAFAQWNQARLPTEFELEYCYQQTIQNQPNPHATQSASSGFYQNNALQPKLYLESDERFYSLMGNLWEWTSSQYTAYPGYQRPKGALGEYNQKFMLNQCVLRGGSYATPLNHFRFSYRNFFKAYQSWAFTGLRLAKDYD